MENSPKSVAVVCVFAVISILLQWHSVNGFIMDAQRDRFAMFRPRMDVVKSTVASAVDNPTTTAETPESTLSELMELILPAEGSEASNAPVEMDEEGLLHIN